MLVKFQGLLSYSNFYCGGVDPTLCLGRANSGANSDGREFAVCGGGCLGGAVGHSGTWLTALGASGHIENLPYTSYTFTGKLDLRDVHLPDVYLPDVDPRRRISRRRAPRTQACTLRACISRACTS